MKWRVIFITLLLGVHEAVTVANAIGEKINIDARIIRREARRHINKVNKELGEAQLLKRMEILPNGGTDAADRMLMRSKIRKHKARTSSLDTSIGGKAVYTKHGGKFVKWGKCSQKQHGCSKVYAVCAAAAQADCSADSSCRALAVQKVLNALMAPRYIKYTDSGCVAENTYDDRHWDMYFQAPASTPTTTPAPTTAQAPASTPTTTPAPTTAQASCSAGQIQGHSVGIVFQSDDNSETSCRTKCQQTSGCAGFDYTLKKKDNSCRGVVAGQTPRMGNPGGDDRKYCRLSNVEAPASTPTTTPAPTTAQVTQKTEKISPKISFGGGEHSTGRTGELFRPEQIRSEQCVAGTCTGCSDGVPCLQGQRRGRLQVIVPGGTDVTEVLRTAEVWVQCASNKAQWKIWLDDSSNGLHSTTNSQVWALLDGKKEALKAGDTEIKVPDDGQNHRLVVVHKVTDMKKDSSAKLSISVKGVSIWVDVCMTKKLCMKELGDGSNSAYNIRNSNLKQRNCLNGKPAEEDLTECDAWKTCLKNGETPQEQYLKALKNLLNAMAGHASLAELEGRQAVAAKEDAECMDPSAADPESLECECWGDIESQCGKADDQETCFQNHLCKQPKVSCTWKQENCVQHDKQPCCTGSIDLMQASMRTSNSSTGSMMMMIKSNGATMHDKIAETLEGTLRGKCSV